MIPILAHFTKPLISVFFRPRERKTANKVITYNVDGLLGGYNTQAISMLLRIDHLIFIVPIFIVPTVSLQLGLWRFVYFGFKYSNYCEHLHRVQSLRVKMNLETSAAIITGS